MEILQSIEEKHVEDFGDSLLVYNKPAGMFQCFEGSLNAYLDKCLDIITYFPEFRIQHIIRH
jgi:hypothetical protein